MVLLINLPFSEIDVNAAVWFPHGCSEVKETGKK